MEARVGVSGQEPAVDGGSRKFHHHQQQQQEKPSVHQQAPTGTVPQLLAGGIAGAFSKTCTAPLARLTILFQVQGMQSDAAVLGNPSIWREASRIVNEEGFRAFWKGNLVTIVHRLPYSSVNFYAYDRYKNLLKSIPGLETHKGSASADIFVHFVGGGLAGITAASATYPLDLVRTRLAAQRIVFKFLATFPLDLVRRRMQLEGVAGQARVYKSGLFGTFVHIVRSEGLRGLYRGILPEYYKVVPSVGIVFTTYETLKKLLSNGPL